MGSDVEARRGTVSSGIGAARKSRRQINPNQRAQRLAVFLRALSVAIPVFAYICR
jgi:hypothetical protein